VEPKRAGLAAGVQGFGGYTSAMAVAWTEDQEAAVKEQLQIYPAATGLCRNLARALLPVARERDEQSHGLLILPKPGKGYRVVPKVSLFGSWDHHFTVGVDGHCVDALTGASGTERDQYLARHWQYADAICIERCSLEDESL
jgi:hypothetical protein